MNTIEASTIVYDGSVQEYLLLEKHLQLVLQGNKSLNLTRINTLDAGHLLHIEDSLTALSEIEKAPKGALADIGSGAGYPGIPLAVFSKRKTTLIESIKKKACFLETVIAALSLEDQITVLSKRTEEIIVEPEEGYAAVVARAVSELPVIVELASPLLNLGGVFIAYKGNPSDQELERGALAAEIVGMVHEGTKRLTLSDGLTERTLIIYKKTREPQITLPRRIGVAQKRPLA